MAENENRFFSNLREKEARVKTVEGIRQAKFGNHLRSFAAVKASLTLKDARLEMIINYFHQNLFKSKRVLDIGSHSGLMSLQIGALYDPKLIIGVDIDPALTNKAIDNMHRIVNDEGASTFLRQHMEAEDKEMPTEQEQGQATQV